MNAAAPTVIFDLDGTLLSGDSFLPFLWSFAVKRRSLRVLPSFPFYCGLYACRLMSDRNAKERLIRAICGAQPMSALSAHAEWFCEAWLPNRIRPVALEHLRRHQAVGCRVILLSASPNLYVPAIAQRLGISEVVCTEVGIEADQCTGRLKGGNCKGSTKVHRLRAHLGCDHPPAGSVAYGDQEHDLAVLRWVSRGYLLNKRTGQFDLVS